MPFRDVVEGFRLNPESEQMCLAITCIPFLDLDALSGRNQVRLAWT